MPECRLPALPRVFRWWPHGRPAVAHRRAQRDHRRTGGRRLRMHALRQLRRQLQGMPLRHVDPRRGPGVPVSPQPAGRRPAGLPRRHRQAARLRQHGRRPAGQTRRLVRRTGPQEAGGPRCGGRPRHRRQDRRPVPRRLPLLVQPGLAQRRAGLRAGAGQGRPGLRHRQRRGLLRRQGLRHGLPRRLRSGRQGQPREVGGGRRQDHRHPLRHLLLDLQAPLSPGGRRRATTSKCCTPPRWPTGSSRRARSSSPSR